MALRTRMGWGRAGDGWLLALAALLLGGCHSSAPSRPRAFIQVDLETSPISLDPRFATDAASSRVEELMFDSLMKPDAHGNLLGDLAESFERPTPTELVFHLRRGAKFGDGRRLTALDVKFTYDSVRNPATLSPKRAQFSPLVAVEAPDDETVVMITKEPLAAVLDMATLGIVPEDSTPAPIRQGAPMGSGPFRLKTFTRDESVVLERNAYHDRPRDTPDGIYFKIVPDPTVRALELAKGICDFAENNIQPDLLAYLRARPGLMVRTAPGIGYHYIAFNFRDARLRDLRTRQAIAYAIDRRAIVHFYRRDLDRLATGMLAPENWAYNPDVRTYDYDPARARQLLEQAGYTRQRPLSLVFKTTPEGRALAEIFQAMLRRVGIDLKIQSNEFATFYSDIQRGNFDLVSLDWVGVVEPHHYYMIFDSGMTPPHGLNRGWYSNPEMDRLTEAGETELDPEKRRRIYARVQQLAASDLPYISLWWEDNVVVMNRNLAGFAFYPNGSLLSLANITFVTPSMTGVSE